MFIARAPERPGCVGDADISLQGDNSEMRLFDFLQMAPMRRIE
jgi:hypothetical protein